MSGATIMLIGWGALILTHWASSKPTISVRQLIEMGFAVLLVAFLDSYPSTEGIAKGLAWLFLAAVLLRSDSILTALARRAGTGTTPPKAA